MKDLCCGDLVGRLWEVVVIGDWGTSDDRPCCSTVVGGSTKEKAHFFQCLGEGVFARHD